MISITRRAPVRLFAQAWERLRLVSLALWHWVGAVTAGLAWLASLSRKTSRCRCELGRLAAESSGPSHGAAGRRDVSCRRPLHRLPTSGSSPKSCSAASLSCECWRCTVRELAGTATLVQMLATRLARAASFRNVVAHADESVDMQRVYAAALQGTADLRAFLARARDLVRAASRR